MKKLLSLLTITTLTTSAPAPLLANTVQTRAKRDVSNLTSNSNNDYIPINKITSIGNNANAITFDSKNNIYFGTDTGAFVLKHGETTPTPIDGISGYFVSATLSLNGNLYFGTTDGAYKLQTALSWTKTQSQFTLVDSTKMQTWTRPDLLSVDGELNIDIANPNIDKVVFDNVEQGQTNKH